MIRRILMAVVVAYLCYAVAMVLIHPRYIYPFDAAVFAEPGFEQASLDDGATVYVSSGDEGAPVILYFMGNVGTLTLFAPMLRHHRDAGRSVVALAYPGGGGIPGEPSEAGLKAAALSVFDALPDLLPAHPDSAVIAHGYSLGTGLALHLAAARDLDGVLLSAPYTRLCRLMADASLLPACLLPGVQKWDSLAAAPAVSEPVLVLHGTADGLIPVSHGEEMADTLPDGRIYRIEGGGHADLMDFLVYLDALDGFVEGGARP
ncbi:MAG: alpha/beta hydrolase [Pseudomonadota bacterium]